MSEYLVETDVYVADDSLHSDIARQTGKPPRSTDRGFRASVAFRTKAVAVEAALLLKCRNPIPRKGLASKG